MLGFKHQSSLKNTLSRWMMLFLLSALSIGVFAKTPVDSESTAFRSAIEAYQEKRFQAAFELLEPLAKQGNRDAQYNLAVLYQDGLGVLPDDERAFYWYRESAKQGLAEAQFVTAWLYSQGKGVVQDYEQAVFWYQKAANQNHIEAQNNLAARYATGTGVPQNMALAKQWYQRAANQGSAYAAYVLQQMQAQKIIAP